MDDLAKARTSGLLFLCFLLLFFGLQTYLYASEWIPWAKLVTSTQCTQIYVLYLWEVTQGLVWIFSLLVAMIAVLRPDSYRILLVSSYFLGPVLFAWTATALGFYSSFLACCDEAKDSCTHFQDFRHAKTSYEMLAVTMGFSGLISTVLLCMVGQMVWDWADSYLKQYIDQAAQRLPPI